MGRRHASWARPVDDVASRLGPAARSERLERCQASGPNRPPGRCDDDALRQNPRMAFPPDPARTAAVPGWRRRQQGARGFRIRLRFDGALSSAADHSLRMNRGEDVPPEASRASPTRLRVLHPPWVAPGKGSNAVAPLRPRTPRLRTKAFAKAIATAVAAVTPRRYVATTAKAKRGGKSCSTTCATNAA